MILTYIYCLLSLCLFRGYRIFLKMDKFLQVVEILETSSSSSESDADYLNSSSTSEDDEQATRIVGYVETIVINYNEVEFRQHFRLTKDIFEVSMYYK